MLVIASYRRNVIVSTQNAGKYLKNLLHYIKHVLLTSRMAYRTFISLEITIKLPHSNIAINCFSLGCLNFASDLLLRLRAVYSMYCLAFETMLLFQ